MFMDGYRRNFLVLGKLECSFIKTEFIFLPNATVSCT